MKNQESILDDELKLLRAKLINLNREKEFWFSKIALIRKVISEQLATINVLKEARSKSMDIIKKTKVERDSHNDKVKELIGKIKNLNSKKDEIIKKHKLDYNPRRVLEIIDALERKIEIEAISFEQEKKVMKRINELKRKFKRYSGLNQLFAEFDKISKDITEEKIKANESHKKWSDSVWENKEENRKILDIYKKLDKLRKEKDEYVSKFVQSKNSFIETNHDIREKLRILVKSRKKNWIGHVRASENNHSVSILLSNKIRVVEDKIKKGEKLTTEDIITYQKIS